MQILDLFCACSLDFKFVLENAIFEHKYFKDIVTTSRQRIDKNIRETKKRTLAIFSVLVGHFILQEYVVR